MAANRILVTHAGSLPRPPALADLHLRKSHGEAVDEAKLEATGREALDWVVGKQLDAGIDIPNNGEQQRDSFVLYVKNRLSGLGGTWDKPEVAQRARYPEFNAIQRDREQRRGVSHRANLPAATGEVRYVDVAAAKQEPRDLKAALAKAGGRHADAFITAPSPGYLSEVIRNQHYDSLESYLDALGEALRTEYEAVTGEGFLIQIDAPFTPSPQPKDLLGYLETTIAAMNKATRNIPAERIRYHFCWGNYEGPHDTDIELKTIASILAQARVGAYVLPFANPRHAHEYRYLKPLTQDGKKKIVAGAIETTTNYVEHPEVVADRIERVARAIDDPDRVIAGTDCGFSTSIGASPVASDVAWAKMASLSDGARIATERLYTA
jgi:5-methyltetrahydropteroyltriglutamate--homocysteine methyltransferase